jgi:hypothetical protein
MQDGTLAFLQELGTLALLRELGTHRDFIVTSATCGHDAESGDRPQQFLVHCRRSAEIRIPSELRARSHHALHFWATFGRPQTRTLLRSTLPISRCARDHIIYLSLSGVILVALGSIRMSRFYEIADQFDVVRGKTDDVVLWMTSPHRNIATITVRASC